MEILKILPEILIHAEVFFRPLGKNVPITPPITPHERPWRYPQYPKHMQVGDRRHPLGALGKAVSTCGSIQSAPRMSPGALWPL